MAIAVFIYPLLVAIFTAIRRALNGQNRRGRDPPPGIGVAGHDCRRRDYSFRTSSGTSFLSGPKTGKKSKR
jgi:hypothetical protein